MNPLVSIITVQYNRYEETLQFLESISQIEYENYEVIVVDNGSELDAVSLIQNQYPEVHVIASKSNLGFAGGNNLGLSYCKGEYILFINNDTEVEPDFLGHLVHLGNTLPNLGIVSPRIQYFTPKGIVQYAGSTDLNMFTLRNRSLGYGEVDNGQYTLSYRTAFVHGAAMLVPKSILTTVGLMDECFFLYYEEYDWCARLKAKGLEVYFCGESLVYHKESISVGKSSPLKIYYMTRNRIWYAIRNVPFNKRWITLLFLYGAALPKQLLQFIFQKRWDLFRATWRGALFRPSEYENRNRGTADI